MKKIPTLFIRDEEDRRYVTPQVTPGCEWVLAGEGVATRKYDGTCVLLDTDGKWWARREVKPGKATPQAFHPIEIDEVTGKIVGWEPAEQSPFAKWLQQALLEADANHTDLAAGTYELIGPKVNGNPERCSTHELIRHDDAEWVKPFSLTFDGLRDTVHVLYEREGMEGLVWHHPDGRMAKLKARDFPS